MNDVPPLRRDVDLFANFYDHQTTEFEYLSSTTSHRLLFWEQGVGKSPIADRRSPLGQALGEVPKLYLCPASCKVQVARELVRWGGPGTRVQILEGRRAKLTCNVEWSICNFDLLLSNDVFAQLIGQHWHLLIIDESHLLRNLSAKRTQRVFGAAPCLADQADRVVCLSGTPVVNSPADIYPMVNRLFPRAIAIPDESGELRRMQFNEFVARYCTFKTVHISAGRTLRVPAGAQNVEELRTKLAPHMSRLRRKDVLDLPALRLQEFALSVTSSAELLTALRSVPQELLDQLQAVTGDELLALLRRHAQQTGDIASCHRRGEGHGGCRSCRRTSRRRRGPRDCLFPSSRGRRRDGGAGCIQQRSLSAASAAIRPPQPALS